jgi:hypothetical protein
MAAILRKSVSRKDAKKRKGRKEKQKPIKSNSFLLRSSRFLASLREGC